METKQLFLKDHVDPVESLEKTNEEPAGGEEVENVEPHVFRKEDIFVILYGESFVWSIGRPAESCPTNKPELGGYSCVPEG